MEVEVKAWLSDIKQAIDEINLFVKDVNSYSEFAPDLKTKRAVERNIEIIGEAMKRILAVHPEFSLANARKIVDTRNRIIHGYDSVSEEIVWAIVKNDLPKLEKEIAQLLEV